MRRRLGVASVGVLLLAALSACGGTGKNGAPSPENDEPQRVEVIEPRAVAALVAESLSSQGRPKAVSVEETEASTSVDVHWPKVARVTSVRVVMSDEPSLSGSCEAVSQECEDGTSGAGDFVILRSSKRTVEGFRQSVDGSSLTMTSYGDESAFDVMRTLVMNTDLSRAVPESVNDENRWRGRLRPLRVFGSAENVRR